MKNLTWQDYKTALENELLSSVPEDLEAPQGLDIQTDSRKQLKGKWFLPLRGDIFDGHSFLEDALKSKEASGAFCEIASKPRVPKELHNKLIFVSSTLEALQKIASHIRRKYPELIVFAITGSVGKTTTKNMLASILKETKKDFLVPIKNYNNEVGLPLTLLHLNSSHKYAVLEMGARKKGDISLLKKIAEPRINLCLGVGSSHIEIFGSKENIYQAKLEIIKKQVEGQRNIVFGDDKRLLEKALRIDKNCYTFGYEEKNNAQILEETLLPKEEKKLTLRFFSKELSIKMQTPHKATGKNALAAALSAHLAGIPENIIKEGLGKFRQAEARFRAIKSSHFLLIDDSYNASLESMIAGLETLEACYPTKKKTYILADMLELGSYSREAHLKLARFCLNKTKAFKIISIGEKTKEAFKEALLENKSKTPVLYFPSASSFLQKPPGPETLGEVLYLKGSSGMNLKKIVSLYIQK